MARSITWSRREVWLIVVFVLDTNVFAALCQARPLRGVERAFAKHADGIMTASIVVHEMCFGIARMVRSRRRTELERFMTDVVGGVNLDLRAPRRP